MPQWFPSTRCQEGVLWSGLRHLETRLRSGSQLSSRDSWKQRGEPSPLADRSACETDRARDRQRPTAPFSAAIDLLYARSLPPSPGRRATSGRQRRGAGIRLNCNSSSGSSYLLQKPITGGHPLSEDRLKNRAAREWAGRQRSLGYNIDVGLALETDIRRSSSWPELRARLR